MAQVPMVIQKVIQIERANRTWTMSMDGRFMATRLISAGNRNGVTGSE